MYLSALESLIIPPPQNNSLLLSSNFIYPTIKLITKKERWKDNQKCIPSRMRIVLSESQERTFVAFRLADISKNLFDLFPGNTKYLY